MVTNAQLGRDADAIIQEVTGEPTGRVFVNRTKKYISVKIEECGRLSKDELEDISVALHALHPDRFLKVYNNTALVQSTPYWFNPSSVIRIPKVNVRFTQE